MLTYREKLEAELAIVQGIIATADWPRYREYYGFFYQRERELKALINELLTSVTQ